jgi:hypothetical protein
MAGFSVERGKLLQGGDTERSAPDWLAEDLRWFPNRGSGQSLVNVKTLVTILSAPLFMRQGGKAMQGYHSRDRKEPD